MVADYILQFIWGLIILAAFIGWGGRIESLFIRREYGPADWGLKAGWGMAMLLFVGGLISLLGVVSPTLMIGLSISGAVFWIYDVYKKPPGLSAPSRYQVILFLIVLIPLISRYAAAVHYQALSCPDDNIAYFPFISRLLDTGTLIDPFNMRRLAAYGGHTFLQAFIGAVGTEDNAFLMDRGIAVIISFGLTLGFFKDRARLGILPYAITVLVILVLPFPLLNSASHITGLALFLTLFRTLERQPVLTQQTTRSIWLVAMVLAGAASLRAHFLAAGALTVACYWCVSAVQSRDGWKQATVSLIHSGAATLVCLMPWMILLHRSSGSFLYPLIRGNHRDEFENYSASLELGDHVQVFADTFLDAKLLIFMVPVILLVFRRSYPAATALYIGALLTSAAMTWIFTHSDVDNILRYVAPFLYAAFIATMVSFTRDARTPTLGSGFQSLPAGDKIIAGAMIVLLPLMMAKDIERLTDRWGKAVLSLNERALYKEVQSAIPPGEKFMSVVGHPYAFDYARNDVSGIDVPGAASPDPGVPYFKGPQAFKNYFLARGISYLVFGDFDRPGTCLYIRKLWQFHAAGDVPVWKMEAEYYLDLMDTAEALAVSEDVILRKNGFTVLQLRPG